MPTNTLSIISYNIHKGYSWANIKHVLSDIRNLLHNSDVDVVFLQEVIGDHDHSRHNLESWVNNAQFEFLADQIWDHFAYGKNAVYQSGHHGNAILSKYPIIDFKNYDISTNPLESRGVLHATIENPRYSQLTQLFCTHFDLLERGRQIQYRKLLELTDVYSRTPMVIAGDFNDLLRKGLPIMQEAGFQEVFLKLHGRLPATYPARWPLLSLDRIYYKNLRPVEARVLDGREWRGLSDHAALYAELEYL